MSNERSVCRRGGRSRRVARITQEQLAELVQSPDLPSTKGWYANYPETGKSSGSCKGRYLQPNPAATACDEWPWRATEQGEPPANGAQMPHLKIINALRTAQAEAATSTSSRSAA
jgi:hypothetical protein